jgi:hypothetical protein
MFVNGVVVNHEVHVQWSRDGAVDQGEKLQELLMPMPGCSAGERLARGGVNRKTR